MGGILLITNDELDSSIMYDLPWKFLVPCVQKIEREFCSLGGQGSLSPSWLLAMPGFIKSSSAAGPLVLPKITAM